MSNRKVLVQPERQAMVGKLAERLSMPFSACSDAPLVRRNLHKLHEDTISYGKIHELVDG